MAYGIEGGIVEFAYPGDVLTFTVDSSASTSVAGGNLVAITGDLEVDVAGDASEAVAGVALHDAAAGAIVTVARVGVYYLTAANAVSAGDLVEAAAAGEIDVNVSAAGGYRLVIGQALEDIAQNDTGRVELRLG